MAESKVPKKRKAVAKPSVKERTSGMVDTIGQFLREVRVELSKVTWPTRKDTLASTSVVLVIVILIARIFGHCGSRLVQAYADVAQLVQSGRCLFPELVQLRIAGG